MASSSSVLALPSAPTTQSRAPSDQVGVYPYLDYYVCSYASVFWVLNIQDDMLKSDALVTDFYGFWLGKPVLDAPYLTMVDVSMMLCFCGFYSAVIYNPYFG